MSKSQVGVTIGVSIVFLAVVLSYFFPEHPASKVVVHMNNNASVIIMVLTLVYVITTNRQLNVMQDQICVMQNETNLQAQPIPIPHIKECHLEKIRPFMGPEDKFMKVSIMSRFFSDISFKNIGNAAALNVAIYPTIKMGKECFPSPSLRPQSSHCISNQLEDSNLINLMMFDSGLEIAKGILSGKAILQLDIYYKNIFGKGFHEYISYRLRAKGETKHWIAFVEQDVKKYQTRIDKHNALKPIDKDDAGKIFDSLKQELGRLFNADLPLTFDVLPESYRVDIVDYENEIRRAEERNSELLKQHFKEFYDMWRQFTERRSEKSIT